MSDFITNCLEIVPTTLSDYTTLAPYHYRTEPIRPTTQIYKVRAKAPNTNAFPDPIAIIVYRKPIPDLRARTSATKGFFHEPKSLSDRLKLVNDKIEYIARLIVDPRFHKLGLASWLLKDTLERQQVPIVETLTPIDFTNKIFQKAGFKLYHASAPTWYRHLTDALYNAGLTDVMLSNPLATQFRLDCLMGKTAENTEKAIGSFCHHFRHRDKMPPGINRTAFFLSKLPFPEAYLIWFNPKYPLTR